MRACALLAALLAALAATSDAQRALLSTSLLPPRSRVNVTLPMFNNVAAFMAAHMGGGASANNGAGLTKPSTPAPGLNFTAFGDAMQQRVMNTVVADIQNGARAGGRNVPNNGSDCSLLDHARREEHAAGAVGRRAGADAELDGVHGPGHPHDGQHHAGAAAGPKPHRHAAGLSIRM